MARTMTKTIARKMAAKRKTFGGGRPTGVTMPCGWCRTPLTASSIRTHFTECPKRPQG
jgi:hypothetical protein